MNKISMVSEYEGKNSIILKKLITQNLISN